MRGADFVLKRILFAVGTVFVAITLNFALFRLLDLGDIIGVAGHLFRTKTGELTVWVEELKLLTKALLPLPEKWHGLADIDQRYRRRYLDLIVNERAREIFLRRAKIIAAMRRFFDERGYVEVETPMMHPILGGATARPFVTHHNTLDMDLYLRIAPELYLKRLVVGGLDRVYEINRNFRNEGIDAIHQPEFTMLEFYQAYSDYAELMDLTEALLADLAEHVCGTKSIRYGDQEIDFSRFGRLTMREAIVTYWPAGAGEAPNPSELASPGGPRAVAERYNTFALSAGLPPIEEAARPSVSDGELTGILFETFAEPHLIQPTFIYDFPVEISPLSKCRADDPSLTERFELFVAGMELANGVSELNDPEGQGRGVPADRGPTAPRARGAAARWAAPPRPGGAAGRGGLVRAGSASVRKTAIPAGSSPPRRRVWYAVKPASPEPTTATDVTSRSLPAAPGRNSAGRRRTRRAARRAR